MEPRIHIIGFFLLIARVINIESHPRHERTDSRLVNNNKLLTDFSDDVVSCSRKLVLISIINLRNTKKIALVERSASDRIKRVQVLSILDEVVRCLDFSNISSGFEWIFAYAKQAWTFKQKQIEAFTNANSRISLFKLYSRLELRQSAESRLSLKKQSHW